MERKLRVKKLIQLQRIAMAIATGTGCSLSDILQRTNKERNVFLRVLLTRAALDNGIPPYQVSLFLRMNHSAGYYYEHLYWIIKSNQKYQELEQKYKDYNETKRI